MSSSILSTILSKVILNAKLDLEWLTTDLVPISERLLFLVQKYKNIIADSGQIDFLGSTFYYDNRLTPALLPGYIFEIQKLKKFLSDSNSLLDVGANVGQFAAAAGALSSHLKVYSFEPNPEIFHLLAKNSQAHTNWKAFNFGIGEHNQSFPFFFVKGKSSQGSLFTQNASQNLISSQVSEIQVEIKKLDRELIDHLSIPLHYDFIKIDVEGAEREALMGLSEVSWKYLYIELSEDRVNGLSFSECTKILKHNFPNNRIEVLFKESPQKPSMTFQALFQALKL